LRKVYAAVIANSRVVASETFTLEYSSQPPAA